MYKNIAILGIVTLLISIIGAFLASWINHDRYNPERFIEAEVQSCSRAADCTLFFSSCVSNMQRSISIENEKRYKDLLEKHCKENPPQQIVDFVEEKKTLACIKNICSVN